MADVRHLRTSTFPRRAKRASRISFSLLLALAATLLMLARAPVVHLDAPHVYAIKDAQIVTGTGKTIAKGTVVFRDGLITEVGENVKIPADARVINGAGMTVYPGLIDGYTNLGFAAPAQPQRGGGGAAAAQAAASGQQPQPEQALGDPSVSAADQVKPGGTPVEDARSVGITAALTSPRQGIFPGQSAIINLAGDETSKLVLRAPVALTVQFTTSAGFFGVFPNSLMGTVAFIRQSFYDAERYRAEIDRYNRNKRGVNRPEHDRKLAALQPALKGDMPVLFVVNTDNDVRRALRIADEFKLKPILAGALYGYRVADLIKAKNVPVILSVDFPRRPAELPDEEDEPLRALEERAETPRGAARLAQAGVKFAFMSGTLRPQDFIANVQRAVENGLSKNDALRALTLNPAEIFGVADQLGSIEVGKIANLVVTSGDLLARETRVRHVFIDGAEIELKRPETPAGRPGAPGGAAGGRPGATVDPSGEWELTVRTPQGDMNTRLSLRREGERLTGTLTGPTGATPVQNATMTGNQLRFTTSLQIGADTMEATVTATVEGDNIRGVISLAALGSFEFTGTRPR
ncbi:MAG TPA: amidohydrolase family protein [Blastocatellia bacterium]|nr:amidohydrolase family protein [Blastocatellia bacterium]